MISGLDIYRPTIWRTCRALMNERRLACLAVVSETPGLSVGNIAERAGIPENQASINLRALQARGLLTARRDGRWIRYFAEADPLVEHASTVLTAVRLELRKGGATEQLIEALRAFTHSRRLAILRCLTLQRGATCEELVLRTHISRPAVCRHLSTLCRAGLVVPMNDGVWRLMARRRLSALRLALLGVVAHA